MDITEDSKDRSESVLWVQQSAINTLKAKAIRPLDSYWTTRSSYWSIPEQLNLQEKASTNLYSFGTLNAVFVRAYFSEERVLNLRAINRVPHNVVEEKQCSKEISWLFSD